jgi:hypothetical protein
MPVVATSDYLRKNRQTVIISESGEPELPEEWDYEASANDGFLTDEEIARKQAELLHVSPTEFVEFGLRVPDKKSQKTIPFSFAKRRYLKLPYNTTCHKVLLKCGRQVEKSTMLGNRILAYACLIASFNVLYVSPTNSQTKTFSQDRLKEAIETSEVLRAWTTNELSNNVFEKKFINRSMIKLRYAYLNADRTRGIPTDLLCIDEIQDIITYNIPVIEQCASHSEFKYFLYAGTPKSLDNPIEDYWTNNSTQNEWAVPCERHGTPGKPSTWHWNILGESNIGKEGLICDRCGSLLDPMHPLADWVSMNPSVHDRLQQPFEGFRIPQLMVPWIEWKDILDHYEMYPPTQFYNEVLGLSYDSGLRPLTQQDVIANCIPNLFMSEDGLVRLRRRLGDSIQVFAGIDWGTGERTYTVMCLGAYFNGFFTIFWIHRFDKQELDPQIQLERITNILKFWGVARTGVDYGGGHHPNNVLMKEFGPKRIWKYQYTNPSQKVLWQPGLQRFLVHRTEVMTDLFGAIKRRNVFRFPDWSQFETPYGKDFLNIYSEYNDRSREIQYQVAPKTTDDSFHSVLLCFLASLLLMPRPDVLTPTQETGTRAQEEDVEDHVV